MTISRPHELKLQRSKSFNHSDKSDHHTSDKRDLLFPYTQDEKQHLIKEYIDSYDYNVLLSTEDEKEIEDQEFSKYDAFLETCKFRKHNYDGLINKSSDIIQILSDLTVKYDTVTKETYEFQEQSDKLINEYNTYLKLNDEVKDYLHYFELLDTFTRKLNNPSPNIVRKSSFKRMLSQLDECIGFINEHEDFKDYEIYNLRFKQCLVRALTLIRNYVVNNLKTIRDDLTTKISATKINSVTQDALIYTRFGSDSEFLYDVVADLVNRADNNDELEGLLSDCFNFYFGIRTRLIQPKIWEHLKLSVDDKKTLVQFSQGNISFFTKIFRDEFELFHKIFPRDSKDALLHWFQQISEPLNDTLRKSILRESSISSLCELATLLDKYYEYDEEEEEQFEANNLSTFNEYDKPRFENVDLGEVFHPILQDVQSRLVFRAQVYVDENIVRYRPTNKDFQIGHRRKSEVAQDDQDPDVSMSNSKNTLKDCYSPLSKGISLLSKMYQLVSSSVFDDMAHNIVHDCIISLRQAYNVGKPTIGKLDSELFYLKNLLMLRSQIQNFDIEYVSNETFLDFSGIGDIINKIRNGSSVFNDGGILELVRESVPKVVNNMIDARTELQTELRNIVHEFTEDAVEQIIEPISKANPETAEQDSMKLKDNIEASFPRLKSEIEIFIDNREIVTSLIDGVQVCIFFCFFFGSQN